MITLCGKDSKTGTRPPPLQNGLSGYFYSPDIIRNIHPLVMFSILGQISSKGSISDRRYPGKQVRIPDIAGRVKGIHERLFACDFLDGRTHRLIQRMFHRDFHSLGTENPFKDRRVFL
jgi:hypothetical protein